MADSAAAKNFAFEFDITDQWLTYDSSRDKTNIVKNCWVKGSKNVYKKLSGNIANRFGQKRQGVANPTASKCYSEFVWNTSWGATYTLVISNNNLYVVIDEIWYSLLSGLTSMRYVFDKWWDNTEKKDRVLFVHGNSDLQHWSGGFAAVASTTNTANMIGLLDSAPTAGGTGYIIGDVLTISGGTGGTATVTEVAVGVVTKVILTTRGSGYSTGGGQVTTGGIGTGATLNITQVATGSITKTGLTTWQQSGFSTTSGEKKIMIGGVEYTYLYGEDSTTIVGISPNPTSILANSIVLQSVITTSNTPAAGFANDFIKVINNQVWVGSYISRLCYISEDTNFSNYTVPTPRAAGDPELLTLDGTLNGISVRQGNGYISFGTDSWAAITFSDITVGTTLTQQTKVDIKPVAVNQAAYAHEFIDSTGDNIIYLAKDQQVRVVGDFNNGFTTRYPSLSQEIATELSGEDFLGGGLRCIGEFLYITAPVTGNMYLRQERERVDESGQVVAERLWHAPWTANATRVDSIDGVVVVFSNANPQIYEIWDTAQWHDDSPSDEPLPYESILSLAYRGGKRRQGLWSFDKYFTEGYLTPGTTLNLRMNYNYQGALNQILVIINSINQPAYLFNPNAETVPSLGDESPGDTVLGDDYPAVADDQEALPKFKNINSLGQIDCFEYQPNIYSDTADARWEILAEGTNAVVVPQENANFIINKKRTS